MYRCPYLGLDDDPGMYCLFPSQQHRCYRTDNPKQVHPEHQQSFCLHEDYATCPRYQLLRPEPIRRQSRPLRITAAAVAFLVILALLVYARGVLGGTGSATEQTEPAVSAEDVLNEELATSTVVLPTATAFETAPNARQPLMPTLTATSTPVTPTATASVTTTLAAWGQRIASPTLTVTSTVTPTGTPSVTIPSPSPTTPRLTATPRSQEQPRPSPTATRRPWRTHVVVSGESLTSIAKDYDITLDELAKANGLDNMGYVITGQRLIIP